MSPAKRLSRQRFRALCERCAMWTYGGEVEPRMHRYATRLAVTLRSQGARPLVTAINDHIEALARLAR